MTSSLSSYTAILLHILIIALTYFNLLIKIFKLHQKIYKKYRNYLKEHPGLNERPSSQLKNLMSAPP